MVKLEICRTFLIRHDVTTNYNSLKFLFVGYLGMPNECMLTPR